jgi:hypothetical protein
VSSSDKRSLGLQVVLCDVHYCSGCQRLPRRLRREMEGIVQEIEETETKLQQAEEAEQAVTAKLKDAMATEKATPDGKGGTLVGLYGVYMIQSDNLISVWARRRARVQIIVCRNAYR